MTIRTASSLLLGLSLAIGAGISATVLGGCELIVTFDRTLIDGSAALPDATTPEAGPTEAGQDAPSEAGCTKASDCPKPASDCDEATCTSGVCGSQHAPAETHCASNGGTVCDGAGKCVACVIAADCPASTTLCATPVCNTNVCGSNHAALGATCNDSGGTVCDGAGHCVPPSCTDKVKDGTETDVDCGGNQCPACADGMTCIVAADCVSSVCQNGKCQTPTCNDGVKNGLETDVDCGGAQCDAQSKLCAAGKTCGAAGDCQSNYCPAGLCALQPSGNACSSGAQCSSNSCVSGFCCNTACTGTCQACSAALTGQANGTCANLIAGTTAPSGQCTASPPCGFDGKCAAGGVCEYASSGTQCAPVSCSGSTLTSASTCDGAGTCPAGAQAPCAGNLMCAANGTMCLPSCSVDTDCVTNYYCATSTCTLKGLTGAPCTMNSQCQSGVCTGANACM